MNDDPSLANTLRTMRVKLGWTLKEAEKASGVHLSYISAIENERRSAGQETLRKLAEAYTDSKSEAEELLSNLFQIKEAAKDLLFSSNSRTPFQDRRVLKSILFPADAIIRGSYSKPKEIEIVEEDSGFMVDLSNGVLARSAVIRLDDKKYFVRIEVSEED